MAEFKLSYTANEIDEKLGKVDSLVATVNGVAPDANGNVNIQVVGGEGSAIIDVLELPTENINKNAIYRLMTANFAQYDEIVEGSPVYCVETLPETGEVVTDATMSYFIAYYNVVDGIPYGYVDSMLGGAFGIPAGWYPFELLGQTSGQNFNGVITDIEDNPSNGAFAILIGYEYYIYQDGWCKLPFAYEKAPEFDIRWDGVIDGKFYLDLTPLGFENVLFVKVSDEVFSVEQLIGATYTQHSGYEDIIMSSSIDSTSYPGAYAMGGVIIAYSAEETNAALGLPAGYLTNGTYFAHQTYDNHANYTNRLVAPTKITKIDEKFLPNMNVDVSSLGLHPVAISGNYNDLNNKPEFYSDVVRYEVSQSLSAYQKQTARNNIDVYSRAEVDSKISSGGNSTDLTDYAKKSEVETMISEAIGSAIGGSY